MSVEPVVLFLILGVAASLLLSNLKIRSAIYATLYIVLVALGMWGELELAQIPLMTVHSPAGL